MYSPKIAEDLIPIIYRLGQQRSIPMTKVVDNLLRKTLKQEAEINKICDRNNNQEV